MNIFICAMTLFVCVGAQAQSVFVSDTYKFSMEPPPGWEKSSATDAIVAFLEPGQAPSRPNNTRVKETNKQFLERMKHNNTSIEGLKAFRSIIKVSAMPTKYTAIEEYVKVTRVKSAKLMSFKILGEKPKKLGGLPAFLRGIRLAVSNTVEARSSEIYCIHNGQLITVTIVTDVASAPKYADIFNHVVASFTWK
ncbi:MAG: hypothetical protein ABJA67_18140 [Chthonomonadales bacterium]